MNLYWTVSLPLRVFFFGFLLLLEYIIDVFQKHNQCWPLLDDKVEIIVPPYENHGMIITFFFFFFNFSDFMKGFFVEKTLDAIDFASSLGEVPRILPAIIFLFATTQLFVSNRYSLLPLFGFL